MRDPDDLPTEDDNEDVGLDPDESVFQAFAHGLIALHKAFHEADE